MRLIKTVFPVCLILLIQILLTGSLHCTAPTTHREIGPQHTRGELKENEDILKSPIKGSGLKQSIKIGLLVQNNNSAEARNGAEVAVLEANKKDGVNESRFELVVRSMEGPWGTGSKQAVNLVFDEKVTAIVGSHDGRNAHLVEQVATKAHVIFLSAWAGDPTLSQAFVPWFFNCVPNDLQQADFLIEEIYTRRKLSKIAVVTDNGYDSGSALKWFLRRSSTAGKGTPLIFTITNSGRDINDQLDKLIKRDVNCIVLLGQQEPSMKFIRELRLRKMDQPVFGSLSVLGERASSDGDQLKFERVMAVTSGEWFLPGGSDFGPAYQNRFGILPGAVAAYAYDAVNMIIEAIRAAGTDREMIQKFLLKSAYKGVTGVIQFDEKGNRKGEVCLVEIKN